MNQDGLIDLTDYKPGKDGDSLIVTIIICGMATYATPPNSAQRLIHWRVETLLESPTLSNPAYMVQRRVIFDTALISDDSSLVEVKVTSRQGPTSHLVHGRVDFPVRADLTPSELILHLTEWGMHRYKYNQFRSGCLHWCKTFTQRLEELGKIDRGSVGALLSESEELEKDPEYWVPKDEGEFY